ncbi:hypothetical protein GYMLUDRAFT_238770 [Collybiopsis luxurians FD-317 M1]|nr:hypothetical protein GYMLUDRAFT_238770 [Collybiopsis luxurians FD-317 M1]
MFNNLTYYGRADPTQTAASTSSPSSTTSSNSASTTGGSSSAAQTTGSSSSSPSSSSSTPSSSSSSSNSTSSTPSASTSSTQSSSTTSSASSTSATATPTQSSHSSSGTAKEVGAIVGGVIAGLALLTLLSVIFTALRRKRRNARKRPRGSVYLGNMEQSFLEPKSRPNVSSMHSSVPLLSVPEAESDSRDAPTAYTDTPAQPRLPSPYSDHDHGAASETGRTHDEEVESQSGHSASGYLPSPYSQLGHGGGSGEEDMTGLPQSRSLASSPRPTSEFYGPVPVPVGDFSMRALEATAAGSRPGTPVSLSMAHTASTRGPTNPTSDIVAEASQGADH